MVARKYTSKDFPQIQTWGKQWGADYKESQFPKTGFIVDGLAAYFLYSSDSSCCWLENMVANKSADPEQKGLALKLITEAILKEAKSLGFAVAYACTDNWSVMQRAMECGAQSKMNHVLLTKDLSL